jgi:hypothetical protein
VRIGSAGFEHALGARSAGNLICHDRLSKISDLRLFLRRVILATTGGEVGTIQLAASPLMTRKVIQIAASSSRLYVLCDDGEMFRFGGQAWLAIPPIPQGDAKILFKAKRRTRSYIATNTYADSE